MESSSDEEIEGEVEGEEKIQVNQKVNKVESEDSEKE